MSSLIGVPMFSAPHNLIAWILVVSGAFLLVSCGGGSQPNNSFNDDASAAQIEKFNIVIFYVDDMGVGDIYRNDGNDAFFPNIQRLANEGVTFTNAYASAPICGPSRAGLITGRYQQRFGFYRSTNSAYTRDRIRVPDGGLPLTEITIAERMQAAGYATGAFGKWHLGGHERGFSHLQPHNRGFDHFVGFHQGSHDYFESEKIVENGEKINAKFDYLTDYLTSKAISFIRSNASSAFFVFLPYNAPHTPIQATTRYTDTFSHLSDIDIATYLGMIQGIDTGVGRILDTLDELGIAERTLVIFSSDNGARNLIPGASNGDLRGYKGDLYEGGIRVPTTMRLSGTIAPGTIVDNPIISLDISATALSFATGRVPLEVEGVDLTQFMPLTSEGKRLYANGIRPHQKLAPPHNYLFWEHPGPDFPDTSEFRRAVRKGRWKYVNNGLGDELYDLLSDESESNNLADIHPGLVDELKTVFDEWATENDIPLWPEI
jgi:arylsulfatase A-like enzyme